MAALTVSRTDPGGFRIGAFDPIEKVGYGGAATVWRALHVKTGRTAAVKILRPNDGSAADFQREVRAVAALDHPTVVQVYDYGIVEEAQATPNAQAGCHYLAMEYAPFGTLASHPGMDWQELRDVLLGILAGLAHAHARRVIHRDIKPANVLLTDPSENGERVRLTDFGIAHLSTPGGTGADQFLGTARYSAPEQFTAEWREHGPWTDLYALGSMVWECVTGKPPFEGGFVQLMHQHLVEQPGDFTPRIGVPPELEPWLRKLLAKRIERRFRFAAHARAALVRMGVAPVGGPAIGTAFDDDAPTEHGLSPQPPGSGSTPVTVSPTGAGQGLYSLRVPPFVGRDGELAQLERDLAAVGEEWMPRTTVLRGPSGVGKSRLARWFAERSHERGDAMNVSALHGPSSPRGTALVQALAQLVSCQRLALDRAAMRLSRLFGPDREEVVLDVADLLSAEDTGPQRATTPQLRHQAAIHLLRATSERAPIILLLDDVQWDDDVLQFAQACMAAPPGLRVLLVCTVQEEALATRPAAQAALTALLQSDAVHEQQVGALSPEEHRTFVEGLLELDSTLTDQICALTHGNPLFAVQLIGDWVERGDIVPSARGFRLAPGAALQLPDSLHSVWLDRLRVFDAGEMIALEVAACVGEEVQNDLWARAVADTGIPLEATTLMRLLRLRLAVMTDSGWTFVHSLLSNSLRRRAADGGRLEAHHQCLANALVTTQNPYLPETLSRAAWHLTHAGLPEQAEPLLWHLLTASEARGDTLGLRVAARRLNAVLDKLCASADDIRRERIALIVGIGLSHASQPQEALALLETVTASVGTEGFLRARIFSARAHYQTGQVAHARASLESVMQACEDAGLMHTWAEAAVHRAYMAVKRHETAQMQAWLTLAMRRTDDPMVRATACTGFASLTALDPAAVEGALLYVQTAQAEMARVPGRPLQQGRVARLEGSLRFHLGQYGGAVACFEDAQVHFDRGGLDSPINTSLHAMALTMQGRTSEGVVRAHQALKREQKAVTQSWVSMCYAVLAHDAAMRGDLQTWDLMMDARPHLPEAEDQSEPECQILFQYTIRYLQPRCVHRAGRLLDLVSALRTTLS
jgi:eukaryotic-like serine/threonine-protein kinase